MRKVHGRSGVRETQREGPGDTLRPQTPGATPFQIILQRSDDVS